MPRRCRSADPDTISERALTLIAEKGWHVTTMAAIARIAGISEPTLFRYFPTKADVLWHRMGENESLLREGFTQRSETHTVSGALVDAYLEMLRSDSTRLALVKRRLAIVASDPAAAEASWPVFLRWKRLVADLIGARLPRSSASDVTTLGAMAWAALWTAILEWALSDQTDPGDHVEQVRRHIDAVLTLSP